jgi:hypothetical protein
MKVKTIKKKSEDEQDEEYEKLKELHNFYKPDWDKKTGKFNGIKFNKSLFINKLKSFGFFRYNNDTKTGILFVQIHENIVEEINRIIITDHVEDYIENIPPINISNELHINGDKTEVTMLVTGQVIREKFLDSLKYLFEPTLLERLWRNKDIDLIRDEKNCKYVFFKNCYFEITATERKTHNFSACTKFIWKDQLLNREFHKSDGQKSMAEKFIEHICSYRSKSTNEWEIDYKRVKALKSHLGYLTHGYNERKRLSIIFVDSKIGADEEANGRTGKGLIGKMCNHYMNAKEGNSVYCAINGKSFDPLNDRRYQLAGLDTQLIHIEDTKRNVKLDVWYNDITEGIEVKKLYSCPFIIHPKIMFTTNTTIIVEGQSSKGRVIIFEVSDYYNADFGPDKEFDCWFFDDWDEQEWHRYDDMMMQCSQLYLSEGLIEAETINLELKTLHDHTNPSFIMFMDYCLKNRDDEGNPNDNWIQVIDLDQIPVEQQLDYIRTHRQSRKELYLKFVELNADVAKQHWFSQRVFTSWVMKYFNTKKNIECNFQESNGQGYFYLTEIKEPIKL